jgi:hypothetical protein
MRSPVSGKMVSKNGVIVIKPDLCTRRGAAALG